MRTSDPGAVVIRLPEKLPAMTRARHQQRLQEWRARKGWRDQAHAAQPAAEPGEQDQQGAA